MHAIEVVAAGDALLAPSITKRLIEDYAARGAPAATVDVSVLTPREQEVLALIGHGANNTEIGETLFVSEATVKTHVGRILMKLGLARSRARGDLRVRSGHRGSYHGWTRVIIHPSDDELT